MGKWTRACCEDCWNKIHAREHGSPIRLVAEIRETEKCGHCGEDTQSGIYVRIDPKDQA